ncbi:MAG: hypothetical protein ACK4GQ_01275 [Candidatus Hadarchaeales archaeon]
MKRETVTEVAALVVIVGFLTFGAGYMVGSGTTVARGQVGENISVYVKAPGENIYTEVKLRSGMTALDAVSRVIPIKTELYQIGPAVKTIDDKWLLYTVNGVAPDVGLADYQLRGNENIELSIWG